MDAKTALHLEKLPTPVDYWQMSLRPLISLVFIAPMLVLYEVGVLCLGRGAPRNGADVWLRNFLDWIGFGQYFLLPVLVCGILLAWHYLRRDPWTIRRDVLVWMWIESMVFGWVLLLIAQVQGRMFAELGASISAEIVLAAGEQHGFFSRIIGYLGAGIYEELLFRLMLLPVAIGVARACGLSLQNSAIAGILVVSLLFSAAHYRFDFSLGPWHFGSPIGDSWSLYSFTFRFLAGVFFAVLFQLRGFGIAAGSHALYDVATALF